MRFTEYPRVTEFGPDNLFVLDGPDGTKGILAKDLLDQIIPPAMHRNIFRFGEDGKVGKNLGSNPQDYALQIANGTFDDIFVGDYFVNPADDIKERIWDINYFLGCGDTEFQQNHLVIKPDTALYNAQMNASNITTGSYPSSVMYTTNLNAAKTRYQSFFGPMLKTIRMLCENAVTSGKPSAGAWRDSQVDLDSEINIYGSYIGRAASDGTGNVYNWTIDKVQYALARLCPEFIIARALDGTRQTWWLRDPVSATDFAIVGGNGHAASGSASDSRGVRPRVVIGSAA